jgi:hypothetical protein
VPTGSYEYYGETYYYYSYMTATVSGAHFTITNGSGDNGASNFEGSGTVDGNHITLDFSFERSFSIPIVSCTYTLSGWK